MLSNKPNGWVPHADIEEVVPEVELDYLAQYAEGLLPEWGGLKRWIEADKLVLLCHLPVQVHWVVCEVDLKNCTMMLWDSNQHKYEDHLENLRVQAFRPLGRILPQLLKHIGYYNHNPGTPKFTNPGTPKFTEWTLSFPRKWANKLQQNDSVSCGPLTLKSMENRLTNSGDRNMSTKAIKQYREHISEAIYNYSTDGSTIEQ